MHTPNPGSRGHTFVLFPASENVDQKALSQPRRSPEASPRLETVNPSEKGALFKLLLDSEAWRQPSQLDLGFADLRRWTADARICRGRFRRSKGANPRSWPLSPLRSKGGPLPCPLPGPPPDQAFKPIPPSSGLLHWGERS
ncbi:hypothetical protein B296_00052133 [Ensete ventricosum]|uniref:Uncharacterized protein n=1 Tax=Ensete ventricosum TaxID=4639 RepID=A0A426Y064_ENSVE|nr:hypothetical protein B296_00052133 [Ensete ventricosum]